MTAPRIVTLLGAAALMLGGVALAQTADPKAGVEASPGEPTPEMLARSDAAAKAWGDVFRVLMHPRCMNCHPSGDRPLQTDHSQPHTMNISRASVMNGVLCSACHQETNADALGVPGGPPGAPHWGLPSAQVPMVFQGHSPHTLCRQLNDRERTGGRDLKALLDHVSHDALVLWGWSPGGQRTTPPLTHADFVKAFTVWVDGGGACPPALGPKAKATDP